MNRKDIIMIIGPTAIGKSEFAINKAKEVDAEIISADAFQVYKEMNIGTAKVELKDQESVPHHLIDILEPNEPYSVVDFIKRANKIIQDCRSRNKPIIICGGTGFYLFSFLYGFNFQTDISNTDYRERLEIAEKEKGKKYLWEKLNKVDPDLANKIPFQNSRRVIRALDVYQQSNIKPSELQTRNPQPRHDVKVIGLTAERNVIYTKINQRVDKMIEKDLLGEVNYLMTRYPADSHGFSALGYKETIEYIQGKWSEEKWRDLIKQKTRHFAKRQLTWFRRFENVEWIEVKN